MQGLFCFKRFTPSARLAGSQAGFVSGGEATRRFGGKSSLGGSLHDIMIVCSHG